MEMYFHSPLFLQDEAPCILIDFKNIMQRKNIIVPCLLINYIHAAPC